MRRHHWAGIGLALGLTPAFVSAQSPLPSQSPVRLLGVRSADDPILLARAQSNVPTPMPMPMPAAGQPIPKPMASPSVPMTGGSIPGSTPPVQLGMPTPFGSGPAITDSAIPHGATLGPVYTYGPEAGYPGGYPGGYAYPSGPDAYGSASFPQLDSPLYEGCNSVPGYGYDNAPPAFAGILGDGATFGRRGRWSLSAEYLLWFNKSAQFPALLSTSSPGFNGILGRGDSRVILGNGAFGDTAHSGGRFGFTRQLGCSGRWSLEGSAFFLDTQGESFRTTSAEFPVLARPFTNANQNIPFSQVLASPGLAIGAANVDFENMVWGAELNLRRRLASQSIAQYELIAGFRYLNVTEELSIVESFARTPGSPTSIGVPNAISGRVTDEFRTENHFYGGTVGLSRERQRGRWFTSLTGKVSLGQVEQQVSINGAQTVTFDNGSTGQYTGGLLAVPGNIGTYSQRKFAVVPEIGFKVGMQVTPRLRAFVGYNFLYINSILRPGQQIDPSIDITRIPNFPVAGVTALPVVKPAVPLKDTEFFVQGVSFGLQWRW